MRMRMRKQIQEGRVTEMKRCTLNKNEKMEKQDATRKLGDAQA